MDEACVAIDRLASIVEKTPLEVRLDGWFDKDPRRLKDIEGEWSQDVRKPVVQVISECVNGPTMKDKRHVYNLLTAAIVKITDDLNDCAKLFDDKVLADKAIADRKKRDDALEEQKTKEAAIAKSKRDKVAAQRAQEEDAIKQKKKTKP